MEARSWGTIIPCDFDTANGDRQIRLGDEDSRVDILKYPIIVVSAIVAVLSSLPLIIERLWHGLSGQVAKVRESVSRTSSARRDYRSVAAQDTTGLLDENDDDDIN